MNLLLSELFDIVEKQKDDTDRCNLLAQNNNDLVRTYLNLNYNPQVKWLLPEGSPPYKKEVDINSLRNACIFSLIKLFCILKGIENRFHQGNAISKDAEEKILSAPAIKEVLMNSFETNVNDIIVS